MVLFNPMLLRYVVSKWHCTLSGYRLPTYTKTRKTRPLTVGFFVTFSILLRIRFLPYFLIYLYENRCKMVCWLKAHNDRDKLGLLFPLAFLHCHSINYRSTKIVDSLLHVAGTRFFRTANHVFPIR
jgi:hypothetical protein